MSSNKSNGHKYERRLVPDWKRPAGPLNVWRIFEGREKLGDGTTRPVRFSVQDVPEDRYDEAIKHMCDYFIADEATCKALKLRKDPDAINDFQLLWNYLLKKNMSVGAFKLNSKNEISDLVAINILFVETQEVQNALEHFTFTFKSKNARRLFEYMHSIAEKADACTIYGVDTYLNALGLGVNPDFRGQKLAVRLLEARTDIGKKYGITVTSTMFTGPASQTQAERAGFKTVFSQEYADAIDESGEILFPNIEAKMIKTMMKELR